MFNIWRWFIDHGLFANHEEMGVQTMEGCILEHVISSEGVTMNHEKVYAMLEWPIPKNLKELSGVLRLSGYYRKFIKHYVQLTQPLTHQLKKDLFGWPCMVLGTILWWRVETEASGYEIKEARPIAFYSKLFGPQAQLKWVYEKEFMKHYDHHFMIHTDEQSLHYTTQQREIVAG